MDFICGYIKPSGVFSSGSHKSNLEKVSRLEPRKNTRQLLTPTFFIQMRGRVYPTSTFFKRKKLMLRSHQVDACELFAAVRSLTRGQNTSWRGFSGVQRSSMFEKMLPAPKDDPGSHVSPPNRR